MPQNLPQATDPGKVADVVQVGIVNPQRPLRAVDRLEFAPGTDPGKGCGPVPAGVVRGPGEPKGLLPHEAKAVPAEEDGGMLPLAAAATALPHPLVLGKETLHIPQGALGQLLGAQNIRGGFPDEAGGLGRPLLPGVGAKGQQVPL